jgi:hypothetical protein
MGISNADPSKHCHSRAAGSGIRSVYSLTLILSCLCSSATAAADELGRLFFTPQQRQDLDRRRATNRVEEVIPQIQEGPLTLEGHVRRSGGMAVTWVNGVPQYDSRASRDPARVTVVPNEGEPGVSLKVGQIYERTSGEVRDRLNGGSITVGKAASKPERGAKRNAAAKPPIPAR